MASSKPLSAQIFGGIQNSPLPTPHIHSIYQQSLLMLLSKYGLNLITESNYHFSGGHLGPRQHYLPLDSTISLLPGPCSHLAHPELQHLPPGDALKT